MSDKTTHGAATNYPEVEVVYSNGCPVCHGDLWSQEDLDCNAVPCPACNGGNWEGQLLDSLKDGIAVGEKRSAAEIKALRSTLAELVEAVDWLLIASDDVDRADQTVQQINAWFEARTETKAPLAAAKSLLDDSKGEA